MPLPLSKMSATADTSESVALFYVKDGPANPDEPDNKPKVYDIGNIKYNTVYNTNLLILRMFE